MLLPKPENGESAFYAFLESLVFSEDQDDPAEVLAYEPELFELTDSFPGHNGLGCRPDIRWRPSLARRMLWAVRLGLTLDQIPERIYLELSSADFYLRPVQLPKRVMRHNELFSRSREAWVSPERYFVYKQERLEAARIRHHVIIVLLRWQDQQAIFDHPAHLEEMILAEMAVRLPLPLLAPRELAAP